MKTHIARTLGVKQLYHYQPAKLDWLQQTISENTVHCPSPQDFNDPWDCQPCFDDSVVDDPAERARLIEYLDGAYRRQFPGKPEDEYRQRMQQVSSDANLLRSMIRQLSDIGNAIGEQYRVYCLSTLPDSILMWGLYAEKHRGLCLGFSTENEQFGSAYKVEYCDAYPKLNYADNDDEVIILPMITKSSLWSRECEFRVISEEASTALSAGSLHTENKLLSIPEHALTSVIFGCLTPKKLKEEVRALIDSSGHKIELMEAQRIPNRYALSIGPYETAPS